MPNQVVPSFGLHNIILKHIEMRSRVSGRGRQPELFYPVKGLVVHRSELSPTPDPAWYALELEIQNGRLQVVQSTVIAPTEEFGLRYSAMISETAQALREFRVAGHHSTGVAVGPKHLRWVKRKGTGKPPCATTGPQVRCPKRLCRVFDDQQAVPTSDLHEL